MKPSIFALGLLAIVISTQAAAEEVVLHRLYPKTRGLELGLDVGVLLNPTFVDTTLTQASLRYFFNETWGVGLGVGMAQTKDRGERECVESFYNDPDRNVDASCASADDGAGLEQSENANIGPAYVPIRELRQVISLYADYTIAYGKQILLHGATSHFDLRLRFGAGMTVADYYEERTHVRGDPNRSSRGDTEGPNGAGVDEGERDSEGLLYGTEGRPTAQRQTNPHLYLALAEELLIFRRFYVGGEFATYLLLGGPTGPEPFFVVRLGAGTRF